MSVTPNARLSSAARLERDRRIAEARDVDGLTWRAIGARFGLDERSARRAYSAFLRGVEAGEVAEVDVDVAIARVVRIHLAALARLEQLVDAAWREQRGGRSP